MRRARLWRKRVSTKRRPKEPLPPVTSSERSSNCRIAAIRSSDTGFAALGARAVDGGVEPEAGLRSKAIASFVAALPPLALLMTLPVSATVGLARLETAVLPFLVNGGLALSRNADGAIG